MGIKEFINLYIHGRTEKKDIRNIINDLPENEIIAKDILHKLNNNKTKFKLDDDIKGSYYVFLNNTIYISNKSNGSKEYSRLTLIAHECIHSIQSKVMQVLNFILSNTETIFFIVLSLLKIFNFVEDNLDNLYYGIVILSIVIRVILELHASIGSITLTGEYITKKANKEDAKFVTKIVRFQVIFLLPLLFISLFFWNLVRVIVINIL